MSETTLEAAQRALEEAKKAVAAAMFRIVALRVREAADGMPWVVSAHVSPDGDQFVMVGTWSSKNAEAVATVAIALSDVVGAYVDGSLDSDEQDIPAGWICVFGARDEGEQK